MLDYQINESINEAYAKVLVNEGISWQDVKDFALDAYTDKDENGDRHVNWTDVGIDAGLLAASIAASLMSGGAASGTVAATAGRTAARAAAKAGAKAFAKNALKNTAKGLVKGYALNRLGNRVGDTLDKEGHHVAAKGARLAGNIAGIKSMGDSAIATGLGRGKLLLPLAGSLGGEAAIDAVMPDGTAKNAAKGALDYSLFGLSSPLYSDAINNGIDFGKGVYDYGKGKVMNAAKDKVLKDMGLEGMSGLVDFTDDKNGYSVPERDDSEFVTFGNENSSSSDDVDNMTDDEILSEYGL